MSNIINTTATAIKILKGDRIITYPPTSKNVRPDFRYGEPNEDSIKATWVAGFANLPAEAEDTIYIVSKEMFSILRMYLPSRNDFAFPMGVVNAKENMYRYLAVAPSPEVEEKAVA